MAPCRRTALLLVVIGGVGHAQPPVFEAASIHPLVSPYRTLRTLKMSGTLVSLDGYNVLWLLADAYGVKDYQVILDSVSPAARDLFYKIEARAGGSSDPGKEDVRTMLQAFLAERFHLAIHREMRNLPVYALVADKSGPALKPGSGEGECAVRIGPAQPTDRNYRYRFSNCTLDPVVDALSSDRPILNRSGLTGRYDIELFATPEFKMRDISEAGDIRFLDAIRKLGLRLAPQNAPVEVIVIDHMDSKPTAN